MLNFWFSRYDTICADNFIYSRFKLKDICRSAKWEVYFDRAHDHQGGPCSCGSVAQGCASALVLTQLGNVSHITYGFACLLGVAWE